MEKGNFKVRCINTVNGRITNGKVYRFNNGIALWDDGNTSVKYKKYEDFIEFNPTFSQNFELVQSPPQYIIINQQSNTVTASLKQGKGGS